jgi:hypothetical protein
MPAKPAFTKASLAAARRTEESPRGIPNRRQVILEHAADASALGGYAVKVGAGEVNFAGSGKRWGELAADEGEKGGLPGTARSHQRDHLARGHIERETGDERAS